MRLRIQTFPPLPDLRVWFIPDLLVQLHTVLDLKLAICLRIQALKDVGVTGQDVVLLLDEFELLNDSPFNVVRDGDLICVKLSAGEELQPQNVQKTVREEPSCTKKRKRAPEVAVPGRSVLKSRYLPVKSAAAVSESSDSSDSDESSSDSSSSSASSSSSSSSASSSSSSSSTSSSSGPPRLQSSKLVKKPQFTTRPIAPVPTKRISDTTVPPGHGKPTTHKRNERRRIKQKFEKLERSQPSEPAPEAPRGSSSTNTVPLGSSKKKTACDQYGPALDVASALNNAVGSNNQVERLDPGAAMEVDRPEWNNSDNSSGGLVLMSSLGNKNKRRGFKQSLSAPVPQKIVFSDKPVPLKESAHEAAAEITRVAYPRLVPPSELQDRGELPSNVFVTSVDVEEGMWDKKGKKKSKRKEAERYQAGDWAGEENLNDESYAADEGEVEMLSYGAPDQEPGSAVIQQPGKFNWSRAEKSWEQGTLVQNPLELPVDGLVGWMELGLNPLTMSPEIMLSIARVMQVGDSSDNLVTIRKLIRPGASSTLFSFNSEEAEENAEEDESSSFLWQDVEGQNWRILHP
ncbi:hypothetical protein BDQ12DRAFT_326920 [Crucibulum laeve]|uniref:Coilin n=1 Tax=Crucibulum laeve TaxID=68775 RepID=A0A5C3LPP9_9AGAR|nr:hypothetical protein BDQ12DRAFT_326920 [Crucibulum laeve]